MSSTSTTCCLTPRQLRQNRKALHLKHEIFCPSKRGHLSIPAWNAQLDQWINDLETASIVGWSVADKLKLTQHDATLMTAMLQSEHKRDRGLNNIKIDHLWIEMGTPKGA